MLERDSFRRQIGTAHLRLLETEMTGNKISPPKCLDYTYFCHSRIHIRIILMVIIQVITTILFLWMKWKAKNSINPIAHVVDPKIQNRAKKLEFGGRQ